MKRMVLLLAAMVTILAVSACGPSGKYLKSLEPLKEPRITNLPDQKVIEVELKGDPNKTAGVGIGKLYSVFFQIRGNTIKQAAPKARWRAEVFTNRDSWIGIFALPVSDNVTELPAQKGDIQVKLGKWQYGEVAEILHIGPYSTEMPTIEKLHQFIENSGYEIAGDHEEEYIKSMMPLFDDPKSYYTIIRYQVKKVGKK
jgi:hypothetical protein